MTPLERKAKLKVDFEKRKEKARALHNHYAVILYNKYDNGKMTYERLLYLTEILGRWNLFGTVI